MKRKSREHHITMNHRRAKQLKRESPRFERLTGYAPREPRFMRRHESKYLPHDRSDRLGEVTVGGHIEGVTCTIDPKRFWDLP